jgi:NADPH-dependent 2,4-dienoyl-CoA reductase/sulfur reductase-like enzyme
VNPRAGHETELNYTSTPAPKRIAVVGAGPAGLACATILAERGHAVDLFEAASEIGGQFNMAKRIPGKEEFHETLRYFRRRLETNDVRVHLGRRADAATLLAGAYDEIVVATGVTPRNPEIPGAAEQRASGRVLSYIEVLLHGREVGPRVAVVGAGGIGFDVSEYLVAGEHSPTLDLEEWLREWGVTDPQLRRSGLTTPQISPPRRQVYLLQRKATPLGKGLGKTTGWIHRAALKASGVEMIGGVNYEAIDERGLTISFGEERANPTRLQVDTVVLCAGQEPLRELVEPLQFAGRTVHLIGGADVAGELDAKRAIDPGRAVGGAPVSPSARRSSYTAARRLGDALAPRLVVGRQVHEDADQCHRPDITGLDGEIGHERYPQSPDVTGECQGIAEPQLARHRVAVSGQRRHDQRREYEVHTHELDRRRDDQREQHVEPDRADAFRDSGTHEQEHRREHRCTDELLIRQSHRSGRQQVLEASPPCGRSRAQDLRRRREHNSTPITASCTSGRLRSVQVSSSAPSSAATTAATCVSQPCSSMPAAVAAITPSPATCAIARSMNTMPRFNTCCPSGTCDSSTSTPATRAGQRMLKSAKASFMVVGSCVMRRAGATGCHRTTRTGPSRRAFHPPRTARPRRVC